MDEIVLYTDGSCIHIGNIQNGGWAYSIMSGKQILHEEYGRLRTGRQDVYRSELEALCQGLKYISKKIKTVSRLKIRCDNDTLIERFNGNCFSNKNSDIWEDIAIYITEIVCHGAAITTENIKSHSGNEDHDRVDGMAQIGAKKLILAPINIIEEREEKENE